MIEQRICHDMRCAIFNETGNSIVESLPNLKFKSPTGCVLRFNDFLLELKDKSNNVCDSIGDAS